ncbi:YybH family protein [Dasania marina]|uniref:YybH family protein n=1 Tax=Dasania marina TaxID=471499 RepID=UPI00035C35E8|nr:nuclear transport factor 2 family protein [Dasania marina]
MTDREAIIDHTRSWGRAYLNGDIDDILRHYSDDALMISFDGIIAKGHDKIRKIYELWLNVGNPLELNYETVDVVVYGDMAYHVLKWHGVFQEPYGNEMMCGACQSVLKRQENGQWLWVSEIVCADIDSREVLEDMPNNSTNLHVI